jgi:phospholipid-binding lipoprotein MlaA
MRSLFTSLVLAGALAACASTPDIGASDTVPDPWEGYNRQAFAFNTGVDRYALGPASRAYEAVTPSFFRARVSDFSSNLGEPVTFANDVLQGEGQRASDSAFRFLFNTTVGLVGLWDAAEYVGVPKHNEDFGQTLASWGVPSGPYLVLPLLGPSNPRDALARPVDTVFRPLTWTEFSGEPDLDTYIAGTSSILSGLNARIELAEQFEQLAQQPEPYTALKRIYSSQRQADIRNGKIAEESSYDDLPDFDEFEE